MLIEQVIREYLLTQIDVPIYLEHQDDLPGRYIFIEKTGSGKKNQLDFCTFAIQSYGDSLYDAATLNEDLKKAIESMVTLDMIAKVKLDSDYNFTDTETKKHRYQAVFDFFY